MSFFMYEGLFDKDESIRFYVRDVVTSIQMYEIHVSQS